MVEEDDRGLARDSGVEPAEKFKGVSATTCQTRLRTQGKAETQMDPSATAIFDSKSTPHNLIPRIAVHLSNGTQMSRSLHAEVPSEVGLPRKPSIWLTKATFECAVPIPRAMPL